MADLPQKIGGSELLIYQTEDQQTRVQVLLDGETVWLTQGQMVELFQTTKQNVSAHIRNVFAEGELKPEATVKKYLTVQTEGNRSVERLIEYYNLDVIISVGYRVKSLRGTQFRIWATQRLKEYIIKGFALDDERLMEGRRQPDYFDELLERVRAIRASEKRFYQKVADIYKTSIDYDPNVEMTKTFSRCFGKPFSRNFVRNDRRSSLSNYPIVLLNLSLPVYPQATMKPAYLLLRAIGLTSAILILSLEAPRCFGKPFSRNFVRNDRRSSLSNYPIVLLNLSLPVYPQATMKPAYLLLQAIGLTSAILILSLEAPVTAVMNWQDKMISAAKYPFSFTIAGKGSNVVLDTWKAEGKSVRISKDEERITTTWTDPNSGLRVTWEVRRFDDFPALDWVLRFENTGPRDSAIIEDVQAMDVRLRSPLPGDQPYRLHRTHGGTPDPQQFEAAVEPIDAQNPRTLDAGHGRSSGKDFPFFRIDTRKGAAIIAIGWSGYWKAQLECPNNYSLRATAGMEKIRFVLHPGESVRSPRILMMHWEGDADESNSAFRRLIYKHYAAKQSGKTPLPTPFCNTCFTRGGGWLNECTAENQISLIKAYAKLGVKAIITDAGWFTGGWPNGAGNFDARKDAYPDGMGPVAAAAKKTGGIYGLWFEPERVMLGTGTHKEHPDWCLASQKESQDTYLLNLGLPEVQDFLFNIVKGYMELPGFRVYRQDFNMDPLPYWRFNDAPDRQGITEMKYVEGLYAFWDRLAKAWPDSLREECASGGHRIDLETVSRLHIAQKTDLWFQDDVDQAAIWGLSQYLPNNTFVAHLNNLDEYSFHSTMASSLCLGWIADAPDFDAKRGKKLIKRYKKVRHLLVGDWYPLLPYSRDPKDWMASRYHRADLDEGMVLAFRRAESPRNTVEVSLHGLDPKATYQLTFESSGKKEKLKGDVLAHNFQLTLDTKRSSEMILYRKLESR